MLCGAGPGRRRRGGLAGGSSGDAVLGGSPACVPCSHGPRVCSWKRPRANRTFLSRELPHSPWPPTPALPHGLRFSPGAVPRTFARTVFSVGYASICGFSSQNVALSAGASTPDVTCTACRPGAILPSVTVSQALNVGITAQGGGGAGKPLSLADPLNQALSSSGALLFDSKDRNGYLHGLVCIWRALTRVPQER